VNQQIRSFGSGGKNEGEASARRTEERHEECSSELGAFIAPRKAYDSQPCLSTSPKLIIQRGGFHNGPRSKPWRLVESHAEIALPETAIHSMIRVPFWSHTTLSARAETIDRGGLTKDAVELCIASANYGGFLRRRDHSFFVAQASNEPI
jgi:hypothetical protein